MFRFTIRELILLTLVVVLGVGWWADRRRLEGRLRKLADYELAEKRQQLQQSVKNLQWQLYSLRNNEFGASKPRSERTPEEQAEVERIMREQLRLIEQDEQLEIQQRKK